MNDIVDRLRGQEPLHLGDRSAAADVIERLRAELAECHEKIGALISSLTLAVDLVEHWGSYASEYFQKKHGLDDDIAKLRAALAADGENTE